MADSPQTSISTQIFSSRDEIRNQIIELTQKYLELENVDLTKTSFLSFIINLFSTLTSNLLFYNTSVYKEFFLTKAMLPESILNLAAFIGYSPAEASYATSYALLTFPLTFDDPDATFTIEEGSEFSTSSGLKFSTYYDTEVNVVSNSYVSVVVTEGNKIYNLPVNIDTTSNNEFQFLLPVRQFETSVQEFQVDADTQQFQFVVIDVPVDAKIAGVKVEVREPGETSWRLYEQFDSVYLMSSLSYGYVYRRTSDGIRLYFGNGLIGVQPAPGSTIRVSITETEGVDGNVIAGTIVNGPRLYLVNSVTGRTQIVDYEVINTSPATGGEDEEGIEEVRRNSIISLTALNRLVSEGDYQSTDVIIPDFPIRPNSIPVLKRSDIKVNEISLFTSLNFNNEVVPARNAYYEVPIDETYIPRETIIPIDGVNFITLFDMTLDHINSSAYYHYIMSMIEIVPTLVRSYGIVYNISATKFSIERSGTDAILYLYYYTDEPDYASTTCEMRILETGSVYDMTNNTSLKRFEYTFSPYTLLKEDDINATFTISNTTQQVCTYSAGFIFRQSLDDFMLSNMIDDSTAYITTIYDIPVVKKSYYDSIDQENFELLVLQKMMENTSFSGHRMLTDFANIKFTNTSGYMRNMQLNETQKPPVIDILTSPPVYPSSIQRGDRYIVGTNATGAFEGHDNEIAQCIDSTNITWFFIKPISDDIVYVTRKGYKYIYAMTGWIVPTYTIPLEIELEVFKTKDYTGTDTDLSNSIKTALITEFSSRFGSNAEIYRSEIVDVVQEVVGVDHLRLVNPKSSIFFNFNLQDFSDEQLMDYGPEYVFFKEENISILVI